MSLILGYQLTEDTILYLRNLPEDEYYETSFEDLKKMLYDGDEEIPMYEINETANDLLRNIQELHETQGLYIAFSEMPDNSLAIHWENPHGDIRTFLLPVSWYGNKILSQF